MEDRKVLSVLSSFRFLPFVAGTTSVVEAAVDSAAVGVAAVAVVHEGEEVVFVDAVVEVEVVVIVAVAVVALVLAVVFKEATAVGFEGATLAVVERQYPTNSLMSSEAILIVTSVANIFPWKSEYPVMYGRPKNVQ